MLAATALSGLLLFAPVEQSPGYQEALTRVEEANIEVNRDPESNYAMLAEALEQLGDFEAELSDDAEAQEIVQLSMLNLARALLVADDAQAAVVMDEAIRASQGQPMPVERFGPTLVEFHDERLAALEAEGRAELQVVCALPCEVAIDERPADTDASLFLGSYRVRVISADGSLPPERHTLELDRANDVEVIEFPLAGLPSDEPPPPPPPYQRMMPRWAEIGLTVVGIGAIVGGGVALSFDGKCPKKLDPIDDAADCPSLYESTVPGFVAIGVGAVTTLVGGVMLTVDEVRLGRHKGRQVSLSWTLRF
ncbi:hypothetical protein G6O69_19455 [Pseudenhygromyxa sp. WMMC2535]|uniref:hypothetical protein n=1 Tax=Pseudenhygromyxa sp. WMMC2535 TaxID=2712867 RepID=UPI001552883E|nr:hypothetical protein [Pseudenhygromyxa sp. WMMC2535]NVB40031.1 hypothetical protein [Pseudenhygromyxa sp. WMMC2535]